MKEARYRDDQKGGCGDAIQGELESRRKKKKIGYNLGRVREEDEKTRRKEEKKKRIMADQAKLGTITRRTISMPYTALRPRPPPPSRNGDPFPLRPSDSGPATRRIIGCRERCCGFDDDSDARRGRCGVGSVGGGLHERRSHRPHKAIIGGRMRQVLNTKTEMHDGERMRWSEKHKRRYSGPTGKTYANDHGYVC